MTSAPEIFGYADPWSLLPGYVVEVKITDSAEQAFDASLVRLLAPDVGPSGPPFRETAIDHPANGRYQGRRQRTNIGSYGIADRPLALKGGDLTFACFVYPTLPDRERQALISLLDFEARAGVALVLDRSGLALLVGDGSHIVTVESGLSVKSKHWSLVTASVASSEGEVIFNVRPCSASGRPGTAAIPIPVRPADASLTPTLAAAVSTGAGSLPRWYFNGKLDRPILFDRTLDAGEVAVLADPTANFEADGVLARWDLGGDIKGDGFADLGPNRLDGRLVNLPTRAVTGVAWNGTVHDWRFARDQYSAIHFHEDDFFDAGWSTTLALTLPDDLPSGIYAVRLSRDGYTHSHVPFFVRGTKHSSAKLALIVPTATYIAYGNHVARLTGTRSERVSGVTTVVDERDFALLDHPEFGRSTYDRHHDGSGVVYGTRLRPLLNLRPDGRLWNLTLDLCLVDWLDRQGFAVDIVTDEDLDSVGAEALAGYRVALTGCHPEYYSTAMLDALRGFTSGGGRLMYLGGNGFYWRVASNTHHPGVFEIRRGEGGTRLWTSEVGEHYHSFTGERGGTWRSIGRPPNVLVGIGFVAQGFDCAAAYRRTEASRDRRVAFMFAGIDGDILGNAGLFGGGAAGLEIDAVNPDLGTPGHALVVARSFGHSNAYLLSLDELGVNRAASDGTIDPAVRSEIVFFETEVGGAVFSVGSIAYVGALAAEGGDPAISRLTRNVIERFLDPTAFTVPGDHTELLCAKIERLEAGGGGIPFAARRSKR